MSGAAATARRLLEQTGEHPVVSLFLDLNPQEFATPPARATQLRSLLDEADRATRGDTTLDHDDREAVKEDLRRLEEFLGSDDAPVSGARALAVFCSGRDGLFEAVQLPGPADARIVIARTPYIEPLVATAEADRWCVTLVSRRMGRIFAGDAPRLSEREQIADDTHGQHSQGGWSQARYERSYEGEADEHLRTLAQELLREWQREGFSRLFLGGPEEIVSRFIGALPSEVSPFLSDARVSLDVETALPADVQEATRALRESERESHQAQALADLEARVAADEGSSVGPAVIGIAATLDALAQRRVQTLVLQRNFSSEGVRCPSCGLLYGSDVQRCPVDDTPVQAVSDLREAAVEASVLQDADVVVIGEGTETPPPTLIRAQGIAALLRF